MTYCERCGQWRGIKVKSDYHGDVEWDACASCSLTFGFGQVKVEWDGQLVDYDKLTEGGVFYDRINPSF